MKNRKRIAQGLIIFGSVVLFLSAFFHGVLAYRAIFGAIGGSITDSFILGGLKSIWLIVAWHWILFGVLALAASFGQSAPRKGILLLCGVAVLVDAVAAFVGVGLFIGDELLTAAGVAILSAAALFPPSENSRA